MRGFEAAPARCGPGRGRGRRERRAPRRCLVDTLQRGVQWEGGAVDWSSTMQQTSIYHHTNHHTLFPLHPPLRNVDVLLLF